MKNNKILSLVIPMYYEEDLIYRCYNKIKDILNNLKEYDYEIIFINEITNENNYNLLKKIAQEDKRVKIITFNKNYGQQYAVIAGIKYAVGDYLVIFDSKIEEAIEVLPNIINYLDGINKYIYINLKEEIEVKIFSEKQFMLEFSENSDNNININTGDFRILSKDIIKKIYDSSKYSNLTKAFFSWKNYKKNPFEKQIKERYLGKKKIYNILNYLGIILVLLSIITIIYILINKFKVNVLPLWLPIIIFFIFFIGIQLIYLKKMVGYLGKLYDEYNLKNMIKEKKNIK